MCVCYLYADIGEEVEDTFTAVVQEKNVEVHRFSHGASVRLRHSLAAATYVLRSGALLAGAFFFLKSLQLLIKSAFWCVFIIEPPFLL